MTLGLTTAERRHYFNAVRSSHTRRIDVDVLTLDEKVVSSITNTIIDGQVNVDQDADVTRSATVTFLDPNHAINFDTDSPDSGALYADRMVRIRYGVRVPELERYVFATVFMGPITGLSRDDVEVTLEAQGKETLVRSAVWKPLTLKKGMAVTDAIRTLMRDRGGETRFNMPEVRNGAGKVVTLPKAVSLVRLSDIWTNAKRLARSVGRQLFYNGAGTLMLRRWPLTVAFEFTEGEDGEILTPPQINYQLDELKNTIEVNGQPPNGKKGAVHAIAYAPATHPLSPVRLGRPGTPRYLVEVIEDQEVRSDSVAKKMADQILEDRLLEAVEVTFDSLPVVNLDPGDRVRIRTQDFTATFRLKKFSIPLAPNGEPVMPIGYLKRITPAKRRSRKGTR